MELSDIQKIIKKIVTHPPLSEKEVEEAMAAIDKIIITTAINIINNLQVQFHGKELYELGEITIELKVFLKSQAPQKIKEGVLDILDMLFPNHRSIE